MKHIFKTAAAVVMMAAVLTACDDQVNVSDNAKGGSAANIKEYGLTSSAGNVLVNRNITFDKDTVYVIHNYFRIQSGFTLTIEPGTVIKGVKKGKTPGVDIAPGTIIIERGAKISAAGNANAPIVFTSNETSPATGDWGGVVILGKADVNICATCGASPSGTDKLGFIEGLPTPSNTGRFGNGDLPAGSYNNDNSGILQYVRIMYAGDVIGTDNELNGLTLGGVGSGTTIDHVEVAYGFDDGFEWFGGTVNAKYLISYRNNDDDFDTDLGFSGKIQFGVIIRDNNIAVAAGGANGFESNGDTDLDFTGAPLTNATFANITILGPIYPSATSVSPLFNNAALIRKGSELNVFNSLMTGFRQAQLQIAVPADYTSGKITVDGLTIAAPNFVTGATPTTTSQTITGTNDLIDVTDGSTLPDVLGLSAAAWVHGLTRNPVATFEYPSVTNTLLDSFFTPVSFRGAFGDSSNAANAAWNLNTPWIVW